MMLKQPPTMRAMEEGKVHKEMKKAKHPKSFKMSDRMQQKSKGVDLDIGFGITKKDKDRAIACDYVIDTDRRKYVGHEPKMID